MLFFSLNIPYLISEKSDSGTGQTAVQETVPYMASPHSNARTIYFSALVRP